MQFSIGVEYALHCLINLVEVSPDNCLTVKELAYYQGVSETYLSKIFTKLRKAGIVKSITGVKGGYVLARLSGEISFWDVVEAIEGRSYIFQCSEIRQKEAVLDKNNLPAEYTICPCLIKVTIQEAEDKMRDYLRSKSLLWLCENVNSKVPKEIRDAAKSWFNKTD